MFMYIQDKYGAVRCGAATGTQWYYANIGDYSFASGSNNKASGSTSAAFGFSNSVTNAYGMVWGQANTSGALGSTVLGLSNTTIGRWGFTQGEGNLNSVFMASYFGRYAIDNVTGGNSWAGTDPLFVVGNGASAGARNNALTLTQNARLGINKANPLKTLDVNGDISLKDTLRFIGTVPYIKTNYGGASDLHFTTGTGKTIVYDTPVYEDLNFNPDQAGGVPATVPDDIVINNVFHKEFTSANNQLCGSGAELPHKYKLSTTLTPHIHIFLKSGESVGTTGVTFTLYWELRQSTGTTSGSVALSATSANLGTTSGANKFTINGTAFAGSAELGGQLSLTLARTGGDAGDIVVTTFGVHYAIDTPGSRTITTK